MRQHLALSEFAFNVINTDMIGYSKANTLASFISHIIRNYYDSPDVSFYRAYLKEKANIMFSFDRFESDIEESIPNDYDHYFIYKLCVGIIEKMVKNEKVYPNDVVIKPYIKNEVADLIDAQMGNEEEMFCEDSGFALAGVPKYLKSRASYIKHILETYARQTPFKREAIIYKDIIDEATKIEQFYKPDLDSSELKLNLYRIEIITINGDRKFELQECLAKPYRVTTEQETIHPYLLAYTYRFDPETGKRKLEPDCLPCAYIAGFIECPPSAGSGKLSKVQKDTLENMVTEYEFFGLNAEKVLISFTNEGLLRYFQAPCPKPYSNPRKMRDAANGRKLMQFTGDPRQILDYFSAFGEYAVVLSPEDCNTTMKEVYNDSAISYAEYTLKYNKRPISKEQLDEINSDILSIKKNKLDWETIKDKYMKKNHSIKNIGVYPAFIKMAAENNIPEAFPIYADMLFDGLQFNKDYNLAGSFYGKSEQLSLGQKYNMISIYINGLCKNHSKQEGTDALSYRNMAEEKIFTYTSPEGYTFYAPEAKYPNLYNMSESEDD